MSMGSQLGALSLWAAFVLGLTGGFGHCLTMCGPIVAGASMGVGSAASSAKGAGWFQLTYHTGRLVMYAIIGLVLGFLGEAGALVTLSGPFSPQSLTRYLQAAAGALMLGVGVLMLVAWLRGRTMRLPEPTGALASSAAFGKACAFLLRRGRRFGFFLGMLMALLPCMPIVPAEIAALATGVPLYGATTMLAFGLGTVPALAGFGVVSGLAGAKARGWLALGTAAAVIALGALALAQGVTALNA